MKKFISICIILLFMFSCKKKQTTPEPEPDPIVNSYMLYIDGMSNSLAAFVADTVVVKINNQTKIPFNNVNIKTGDIVEVTYHPGLDSKGKILNNHIQIIYKGQNPRVVFKASCDCKTTFNETVQ